MTFTWTWDAPTRRLTVVCTGLTPAANYKLDVGLYLSFEVAGTGYQAADGGGGLTLILTDVDLLGPGNLFDALVIDQATETVLACNVFTVETSSSGDGLTAAFSHDGGVNYSVQVQTVVGVDYEFFVFPATAGTLGGGSVSWTGNGTLETKTIDTTASPIAGGLSVRAILTSPVGGSEWFVLAAGLQVQGSAGAATGANPGGGAFDATLAGPVEAVEGAWVFAYNGADIAIATGSGLVPGRVYGFGVDAVSDSAGALVVGTADGGGNVVLTQTGIVDPSGFGNGPGFYAWVASGSVGKAATIFEYGTASAGGVGLAGVEWTFDGVEFGTISFPTVLGVEYDINQVTGQIDDIDGPIIGDGTVMTIHWRIRQPPPNADNTYLSSQYIVAMYNNTVFEDLAVQQFEYSVVFPAPAVPPILIAEPPWRFVVADVIFNGSSPPGFSTLTFLDHRATSRQLRYFLRKAPEASGQVAASDPEVNIVQGGEPYVEEGVRILIGLRREGGTPPWKPRFAGPILQATRSVQGDAPFVDFTAYGPRQLLYLRPVRKADGLLLGPQGLTFKQQKGSAILLALLNRTETADGPTFIDFTTGTLEDTDPIDINFQQGSSVGEALDQLEATGTIDILLPAVYDPAGSPGILAQLNIYVQAGSIRRAAILAWDLPGRNLDEINWLEDGAQRANNVELYTEAGTPTPIQVDAASVAKYGSYWGQQTYPVQTQLAAIEAEAAVQLLINKGHPETLTLGLTAGRAPIPFNEWWLADWLPLYASARLGKKINGAYRVYDFTLNLEDDSTETVRDMLVSANKQPA